VSTRAKKNEKDISYDHGVPDGRHSPYFVQLRNVHVSELWRDQKKDQLWYKGPGSLRPSYEEVNLGLIQLGE